VILLWIDTSIRPYRSQLGCPTPPQPIRSRNLKAFDAHVQAEFSALYRRLQEELQSRLSQQGLILMESNEQKKSVEEDMAQTRQAISKNKKRCKGLQKSANKTKRQLDELDESGEGEASESDKGDWSVGQESDQEVAGMHGTIKTQMKKYYTLLEERSARAATALDNGRARLMQIEAQEKATVEVCMANQADLDEWKAYSRTWLGVWRRR